MKPYELKLPGGNPVLLNEQDMRKIHDFYDVQGIADILKHSYPNYSDTYCEALAKKARSLMWNEELSESEAIEQVIEDFPGEDVETFAQNTWETMGGLLENELLSTLSDMEGITEAIMDISECAARYMGLSLGNTVKEALADIYETAASLQPVIIACPEDVTRLRGKLFLIKGLAGSIVLSIPDAKKEKSNWQQEIVK